MPVSWTRCCSIGRAILWAIYHEKLIEESKEAYRGFSTRVQALASSGMSRPDRIREIMEGAIGTITKAGILEQRPDISRRTLQHTLSELQKSAGSSNSGADAALPSIGSKEEL